MSHKRKNRSYNGKGRLNHSLKILHEMNAIEFACQRVQLQRPTKFVDVRVVPEFYH